MHTAHDARHTPNLYVHAPFVKDMDCYGYQSILSVIRRTLMFAAVFDSPRGNLTRVLVVHLVEGGSSTTGEQINCDLTCYVKKRGKPCGAYLRGKALYTRVLLMCPVNSQNEEKLA